MLLQRVLKSLSQESYDELRKRDSLRELSFAFPASESLPEEADNRRQASRDVTSLQGKWKFQVDKDTDFVLIPSKYLRQSGNSGPLPGGGTASNRQLLT